MIVNKFANLLRLYSRYTVKFEVTRGSRPQLSSHLPALVQCITQVCTSSGIDVPEKRSLMDLCTYTTTWNVKVISRGPRDAVGSRPASSAVILLGGTPHEPAFTVHSSVHLVHLLKFVSAVNFVGL